MDMHFTGINEAIAAIEKQINQAQQASVEIVAETAALVENTAKKNFEGSHAKGAPHVGGDKPNVVSGSLRRSIRHSPIVRDGATGAMTRVGPTMVYGRRVELGFVGTDSAGRSYNQPPYPYFTPAVKATQAASQEIARRRWARAMIAT